MMRAWFQIKVMPKRVAVFSFLLSLVYSSSAFAAVTKHLLVGVYYNYYLLREPSLRLTLFF